MIWIVDASAIVCWLMAEPGARRIIEILGGDDPVLLHAVNLVEVLYYFQRRSERALALALQRIQASGIEVARTMDDALLGRAASLKAERAPIALGDTFAVALAAQRGATLLTTDRAELGKLEGAGICAIECLR